jgi:DNA-binding XRE family transcriptional regulator
LKLDSSKIKAARMRQRVPMSPEELGEIVGITRQAVNKMERNGSTKRTTAKAIAKALRVNLADLILREAAIEEN